MKGKKNVLSTPRERDKITIYPPFEKYNAGSLISLSMYICIGKTSGQYIALIIGRTASEAVI